MSSSRVLLTINKDVSPRIAVGMLLGILIMGIFVVGYDQGHVRKGELRYCLCYHN
jgi:hypothetical protein